MVYRLGSSRSLLVLLLIILVQLGTPEPAAAKDGPGRLVGSAPISDRLNLDYEYFYNANALRDVIVVGDDLVALTDAGVLQRFDSGELTLLGRHLAAKPITAIASFGDSHVLIGVEDGEIQKLASPDWASTVLGRVTGRPSWVGSYRHDEKPSAVVVSVVPLELPEEEDDDRPKWKLVVHDLGIDQTVEVTAMAGAMAPPSAFLLDRNLRLWMGVDQGEWGGILGYVDLRTEVQKTVGDVSGISGIVELRDGTILVHGGMTHMGMTSGFVKRVDGDALVELAAFDNDDKTRKDPPDEPVLPIAHVLEPAGDGPLRVLSYGELYHYDPKFSEGRFVDYVRLRYTPGRRFSVGTAPAVQRALLHPTDPERLLLATGNDGIVVWSADDVRAASFEGQLESPPSRVVRGGESPILDSWGYPHVGRDGAWKRVALQPEAKRPTRGGWNDHRIFLNADGSILTARRTTWTPGDLVITRWEDDTPTVIAEGDRSRLYLGSLFHTPDGRLWASHDAVSRQSEESWSPTGVDVETYHDYTVLNSAGPTWIVHDDDDATVFLMHEQKDGVRITKLDFRDSKGSPLHILDVSDRGDAYLLATRSGLFDWSGTADPPTPSTLPIENGVPKRVCVDDDGNVWVAGDSLHILPAGADEAVPAAGPWASLSGADVFDIAPAGESAVWLTLGYRGALRLELRAEK